MKTGIANTIKTLFNSSDFYKEIIETRDAISKISKRISALEKQVSQLVEIATQTQKKAIIQPQKVELQFDEKLHCYKDAEGHLYCPSCRDDKGKTIRILPMTNRDKGWKCPACPTRIDNPDYNSPIVHLRRLRQAVED